ncbi:hypothetical protein EJ06DRAFT_580372 [Trichodelitschia bisporula]|uniref:Pre-mRNA-splicing factor n=1 Tax=Trichodelitschia bisporula TaxID=703511 RepID=A0A6G1I566_9PEZI|nr:hypothetical protein EJ06DRAFT_580372 [Trichodelitschia bisporula]
MPLPAAPKDKISLTLSGSTRPHRPSHRSRNTHTQALADSDSDSDAEGRTESVSHFDLAAGGAIHSDRPREEKQPLVIPVQNPTWRVGDKRKRQTGALPSADQAAADEAAVERARAKKLAFGLTVPERAASDPAHDTEEKAAETAKEKSLDEQAVDALLGKQGTSGMVLPALSEEQIFHRDYESAPRPPTLDEYTAVPIEEFGAALLRGMGWKDGDAVGAKRGQTTVKPRVNERRPALLGVGAKPASALGIEIGAWGKAEKKGKPAPAYTPVVLRNKKTGETLTEEELQAKVKEQQGLLLGEGDGRAEDEERTVRRIRDVELSDRSREGSRRGGENRRERERNEERPRAETRHRRDEDRDSDRKQKYRERSASADRDRHRRRGDESGRRERDERRGEESGRRDRDERRSKDERRHKDERRERDDGRDRNGERRRDRDDLREDRHRSSRKYDERDYDRRR